MRLGAVTKRGHAEAIFDCFRGVLGLVFAAGPDDRRLADLVTEFVGMTAALEIFGVPPLDHRRRR